MNQIQPDPITALTPAEKLLVEKINTTWDREKAITRLKADMQTAVEIELATIPIYLFTYYSIQRSQKSGNNIRPCDLFANKAGGVIMSVAVEEMLHMSLSSNVLFALGVEPQLYGRAPGPYPTGLPYHNPKGPAGPDGETSVKIPLAKLSYEQLWHFLQIEYPETRDATPQDRNWDTIGQFYSYIRCLIHSDWITDADFQQGDAARQIQHFNYSPNNIDTLHPKKSFDPWKPAAPAKQPPWTASNKAPSAAEIAEFSNAEDSFAHQEGKTENTPLIAIASKLDALTAIETIGEQGEGFTPVDGGPTPYSDPAADEDSHYYKFLSLQAQFPQYAERHEQLPDAPKPPSQVEPVISAAELAKVIVNFPENPTTNANTSNTQQKLLSEFCSALFQYMLIMTETMYKLPPDPKLQRLFFNEGLHRSMIWVLDKLIQNMRGMKIAGTSPQQYLAPAFENCDLGERHEAFANLVALGEKVISAYGEESYTSSIVKTAISASNTTPDGKVHPMHLPDVTPYWT